MALSRKNGLVVVENTISNTGVNLITITEDKLRILVCSIGLFCNGYDNIIYF